MAAKIDIQKELRAHIAAKYRTQYEAAKAWKVSESYVSAVLGGRRTPSDAMLKDAGFKAIKPTLPPVEYVRIERRKA